MTKQKFNHGDLVRVAKQLRPSMSHFIAECDAIVIGSYADQFGGNDHNIYTVYFKDGGEASWYPADCLTLIEPKRSDLLEQWRLEAEIERQQKSDLDWIFAHAKEVLCKPYHASVVALAACLGITNLWGISGEGMNYYRNFMFTMIEAKPYLESGDKDGWLEFAKLYLLRQKA